MCSAGEGILQWKGSLVVVLSTAEGSVFACGKKRGLTSGNLISVNDQPIIHRTVCACLIPSKT